MKTYIIKVDGKRMGTIQAFDIFAACTQASATWPNGRCIQVSFAQ
jgi:hypothetical protein